MGCGGIIEILMGSLGTRDTVTEGGRAERARDVGRNMEANSGPEAGDNKFGTVTRSGGCAVVWG